MFEVRATRAYLAGFGTAGSLLAGAAIVFVLASAVVSFRGWPQVGSQATPASVVVNPAGLAHSSSRAGRSLAFAAAAPVAGAAVAGAGAARTGPSTNTGAGPVVTIVPTTLTSQPGSRGTVAPGPVGQPTSCASGCSAPAVTAPIGTAVKSSTGALGNTVSAAGSSAGAAVTGASKTAAGSLTGISSSVSGAVRTAGSAVGSAVSGSSQTAGSAVTQAGQAVGNLLGSK
jgi:hypothetical protein